MLTVERPRGEPDRSPGDGRPRSRRRALTKRYGTARGIEALTLSVETGEVFGFLGANGAGKTTLIRTLLDLQRPTSGSARLLGLDSRRDSLAIRARVGNLPGGFAFDEAVTGRELLRYLARPSRDAPTSAARSSSPNASTPTSTARSASSRAGTGRRSA